MREPVAISDILDQHSTHRCIAVLQADGGRMRPCPYRPQNPPIRAPAPPADAPVLPRATRGGGLLPINYRHAETLLMSKASNDAATTAVPGTGLVDTSPVH